MISAADMERVIAHRHPARTNLVVPRVSWGFVPWGESDVLAVTEAGYITEYEIKRSMADLRKEWQKRRWEKAQLRIEFSERIKEYFIVVPEEIADAALAEIVSGPKADMLPYRIAGLLSITTSHTDWIAGHFTRHRPRDATTNYSARPVTVAATPWWEVLEVPENAGADQIDTAYRRLAALCHPDSGGSNESMATLNQAYQAAKRAT